MSFFHRFNPRERVILILLGIVLGGLSLHAFVVEPYFLKHELLAENIDQAREDFSWIADAVNNLPQASTQSQQQRSFSGSLTNRVNELVRTMGLKNKLAQMTPVNDSEIRIRFSKIEFSQFVKLLARCQNLGIEVKNFRLDASKNPAIVDSSMVLTG